jgi:hypothetical protein
VWVGETSASELLTTHRKFKHDIETRAADYSGNSMEGNLFTGHPVSGVEARKSNPGFCTELENLAGDGKGKGASGRTVRPKVPMRRSGADCCVVAGKRGNARGAKGAGHWRRDR